MLLQCGSPHDSICASRALVLGALACSSNEPPAEDASASGLRVEAAALGIEPGGVYPLDLFHAERRAHDSNFRIDTNLQFTTAGSSSTW